ncbi:MAG: polysaccharide biosynthesis tyrosine autokinase [Gemmatimonadaceae bacterium]|nr:polysaccharide biosynthesis tyrosine autokinase [Gemmatimonadaceae bacterium]
MSDLVPYSVQGGRATPESGEVARGFDALPPSVTESVGIREYLATVRRHLWLVLLIFAAVVAYTWNSVRQAPAIYRSVSTVRLVDERRAMTGEGGQYDPTISRGSDVLESQVQVLRSRAVAAVAVDLKGLRLIPAPGYRFVMEIGAIRVSDSVTADSVILQFGHTTFTVQTPDNQGTAPYGSAAEVDGISITVAKPPTIARTVFRVASREEAIGHALGGFSAVSRAKTDILDLVYTGGEPWEVTRIANAMAEAFQVYDASNAQQLSRRRRVFLEGQLRQTDSMLSRASGAYSSYRSNRQVFSSTGKASAQEAGLIDIDMRRAELDAEKRTYETLLARAEGSGENMGPNLRVLVSSPGIASNAVVQQLYSQLTNYEKQRDDLISAGSAPTNPDVMTVNALIPETSARIISAVRSQIVSIQARVDALDRLRASGASQIAAAPAAEVEEMQLNQQVETIRKMADQLQGDLQRAKMGEAVEAGRVEIVELRDTPGYMIPNGSRRRLGLGIVLGLIFGVGAAVLMDTLNVSIRRRSDVERVLRVPGLAVIPKLGPWASPRGRIARALPRRSQNSSTSGAQGAQELVTVSSVRSSGAEAYRTLRTNLMFSQALQALRTLVITSASPGEGKTTTAANLAVSFAQQGMRVLLIDCDLRRARLHKIFGLPREPGLTDLVLGTTNEEEATRLTTVTGLYLLTSGGLPPNPSELLGGDKMRRALASLGEAYDLVVIDTPPLLAASDAAILATLADGVVLVLRAGQTENAAAQQAMQQLNAVGARVIGAVLNDPDTKVPQYGAYYRYDYAGATE